MQHPPAQDEQLPLWQAAHYNRDGLPAKDVHVRLNAWEVDQLRKLGLRECASMQRLIRIIVRRRLFEFAETGK